MTMFRHMNYKQMQNSKSAHQIISEAQKARQMAYDVIKGVATKFCLGDGFIGTQLTRLPQKISFSSDFGDFIRKVLENAKKYTFQEKR